MDIDIPSVDSDSTIPLDVLSEFGTRYPLPFRILFLSFLTVLGFATNLHLLAALGIDTASILDVRLEPPSHLPITSSTRERDRTSGPASSAHPVLVHPRKLYPPLYSLALLGLAWTAAGWALFRKMTGGLEDAMLRWRGEPAFIALAVGAALVLPGNVLHRKQRLMFLSALRRIVSPVLDRAVPFCDVILADILTSSAKVLGDVWLAGCFLVGGTGVKAAGDSCGRVWGVPFMTSLPYLFRFRQCLSEVFTGSTPTPRRSMLNALKYASAFPVIILSAMQTVIGDPFDPDEESHAAGERWIGRTSLFNLWVLAVLVNSLYSFWWDVTNDWGLSLLTRSGWSSSPSVSYAFVNPPAASGPSVGYQLLPSTRHSPPPSRTTSSSGHTPAHTRARSGNPSHALPTLSTPAHSLAPPEPHGSTTFPPPPSRPISPAGALSKSPSRPLHGHARAFSTAAAPNVSYPFLRPILLLPDPLIYYLAIGLDLLLRLTWSLKLSPHLHSVQEVESGVFVIELMEVLRRWMWVYLRIEWEAVRRGAGGAGEPAAGGGAVSWLEKDDGDARMRAHEEYELATTAAAAAGRYRDEPGGGLLKDGVVNDEVQVGQARGLMKAANGSAGVVGRGEL
ncbi:hypothetical protein JCM5296_006793 [Sporobolomyces johnsonii]